VSDKKRKTAFVFAGGGSLGAVQVGMLRTLVSNGYQADFVVGSSVGAINAAFFAHDPSVECIQRLERVWCGLNQTSVFPVRMLDGVRALLGRDYLVHPASLHRLLRQHFRFDHLEQTTIPCHVVTTDLLEGIEVRMSSGPLIPALLASTAIPGVFPPVKIDGRYLVDGGAANHTPVSTALDLGATKIVVLPTGYSCTLQSPPQGAIGIALQGINILIVQKLVAEIRRLRDHAEIVVVPPLCPVGTSPYDFSQGISLIERAAAETETWMQKGVELADGVPHQLPAHSHRPVADPYAAQQL
jgi:NTE family protein